MTAEEERKILQAIVREIVSFNDTVDGAAGDVRSSLGSVAEEVFRAAMNDCDPWPF